MDALLSSKFVSHIEDVAVATVVRLPALEEGLAGLAVSIGMDATLVKFVVCLYASCVLGIFNRWMPNPTLRHLYLATTGYLVLQFAFGAAWFHLAVVAGAVYAFTAATLPLRALDGWRHWLCAVVSFGYLTAMHYRRLSTTVHASSIDYLPVQMVVTLKLYTFAYNLLDGKVNRAANERAVAEADAAAAGTTDPAQRRRIASKRRVYADRLSRGLPRLPSPLEYAGYILNVTTVLVGPAFECGEYLAAQAAELTPGVAASRFRPALWKIAQGTACMAINVAVSAHFLPTEIAPRALIPEDAPGGMTPIRHFLYSYVALSAARYGYYFVWKVAEAASVLAGFGYVDPAVAAAAKAKRAQAHLPPASPAATPIATGGSSGHSAAVAASVHAPPAQAAAAAAEEEEEDYCRDISREVVAWRSWGPFGWLCGGTAWDGVSNISIVDVEFTPSIKVVMKYWNAYTQSWLERYFYLRNSQAFGLNRWVTLLASAFWHGLFPGYYVTFGTMAAFMYLTPTITAGIKPLFYRPRVLALRVLFEVVTFFATQWMFTFIMAPFNLYTLEATAVAWAKWRYFGLWAPIVVYAVAMALMPLSRGKGKGKGKGKGTKAAAAIEPAAASDGEKKRK